MELRSGFSGVRQKRDADDGGLKQPASDKKRKKIVKPAEVSIYELVKKSGITMAIDRFLEIYEEDNMEGLLEVKICILQSAGCIRKYNREMGVNDRNILLYYEDWNQERQSNAVIPLNAIQRKILENLSSFIRSLVYKCEVADILYDTFMLKRLLSFFGVVVLSEDASFRHAATLSALMAMRALICINVRLIEALRKHRSQLNTELRKPEEHQEIIRVQDLQASIKNLENKLAKVQRGVGNLRKRVFETRILDCKSKVRTICIQEIGKWLNIHPEMVFAEKYMDFLIIPLCNIAEVASIRKLSFSILKSTFKENSDMVQNFARDTKHALLRLAMFGDSNFSSEAFCLLTQISSFDILEDCECKQLYKFVYLDHPYRATAKMAGGFIINELKKMVAKDFASGEMEVDTTAEIHLLYHLVQFHIKNGIKESSSLLVDSVYEWTPILQDWKTMKTFLLESAHSDEEENALIEILSSCVRQDATGLMPEETFIHFAGTQTNMNIKQKRTKFSVVLLDDLPLLIRRFRDSPSKIINLLIITQYLSLNCYVELRKENRLTDLLEELMIVLKTSSNWKVLQECSCSIKALCDEEHSTYARCAAMCDSTSVDLIDHCLEACEVISDVEFSVEPQKAADLISALKRVAAFSGYFKIFHANLCEHIIRYVQAALSSDDENYLERAKYSFSAWLRFMIGAIHTISDVKWCNEAQINELREMLTTYTRTGIALLAVKDKNLRSEAFLGTCQALYVFNKEMADAFSFFDFQYLIQRTPEMMNYLLHSLLKYVREMIFVDLSEGDWEEKREEATRKRQCLHTFCILIDRYIVTDQGVLAEIFGHYLKFAHLFKDIFDAMMDKIKTQDVFNFVSIIHKCLQSEFLKRTSIANQKKNVEAVNDLKELAMHFLELLSDEKITKEDQNAIALLHDEGIKFSMAPSKQMTAHMAALPNVGYLEILIIFVKLLSPQGCKHAYRYLRKHEPFPVTSKRSPLVAYRKALENGMAARRLPIRRRRRHSDSDEDC